MTTKMKTKLLCAALLSIALFGLSAVMTFAVDATGTWRTEEDATVRVSNCGGGLCASIASLRQPNDPQTGKPKTDINNVDPSKRSTHCRPANLYWAPTERRKQVDGPDL